jgi:hypothetical protein
VVLGSTFAGKTTPSLGRISRSATWNIGQTRRGRSTTHPRSTYATG